MTTLVEQLERHSDADVALRLPAGEVSYGKLRAQVSDAAHQLVSGGIGHGDRVLVRVGDDVSRLFAALAIQQIGAVAVAVNPLTIGVELEHVVARARPAAAVCDEALAGDLPSGPETGMWINDGGRLNRRLPSASEATPRAPQPGDAASIMFTSGSSARPRGAVLSHRAHAAMGRDLAAVMNLTSEDSFLLLSPLFHVGGWSTTVLPALASGCSLVIPGPFSATRFWDDVERWRPTIWTTGLAFIEMVAARGGEPPRQIPFRCVLSNLRQDTWELGRHRLGLPLGTYYGLTENNGRGTIDTDVTAYEPGYVGRPYTAADGVRIMRDDAPLPPGEVGEVELHSESAMSGYIGDPAATEAVLRPGPWVRTGDLGFLDDQGRLFFRGRLKNMIKRSGENVSAEEVELFLLEHPLVRDAAVVAVPDRVREEEIKALVVLEPASGLSAEALHEHCLAGLARFKVPRYLQFVDELPRTVSGKPDIGTIRRTLATPAGSWDSEQISTRGGAAT